MVSEQRTLRPSCTSSFVVFRAGASGKFHESEAKTLGPDLRSSRCAIRWDHPGGRDDETREDAADRRAGAEQTHARHDPNAERKPRRGRRRPVAGAAHGGDRVSRRQRGPSLQRGGVYLIQ